MYIFVFFVLLFFSLKKCLYHVEKMCVRFQSRRMKQLLLCEWNKKNKLSHSAQTHYWFALCTVSGDCLSAISLEPTFGFAVPKFIIFLSPPPKRQRKNALANRRIWSMELDFLCAELHIPGLWSLFSNEPILDLAFQFNLVVIIYKLK